jgi:hypothetical protein
MARERTHAGMVGDWQRLLAPVQANGEELAHLAAPRAKLEALMNRAVQLNQEQAARAAAKQEASRQLREVFPEGQRLANLLRVGIREHYGPRAEKLAEFDLQPFRGRASRKAKPAAEGPAAGGDSPSPPGAPGEPGNAES